MVQAHAQKASPELLRRCEIHAQIPKKYQTPKLSIYETHLLFDVSALAMGAWQSFC